jgi:hypothetical protein
VAFSFVVSESVVVVVPEFNVPVGAPLERTGGVESMVNVALATALLVISGAAAIA